MSEDFSEDFDLIIVGAGMIGSALAVFLRNTNLKIALIESHEFNISSESSFDDRNLVLSQASKNIFQKQNLWENFHTDITPIRKIYISEENRFGNVFLDSKSLRLDALAYSLKAKDLGSLLHKELANHHSRLNLICPATVCTVSQNAEQVEVELESSGKRHLIKSRLLILADGSNSQFREQIGFTITEKNYHQHAIVSNVQTELAHDFTAYERFSSSGPFALLPRPTVNEFGMVFCVNSDEVEYYLNLPDEVFLKSASKRFGRRLGKFLRLGTRKAYPLKLLVSEQQYIQHVLLLGNSSHTIHPNAAQGFNLGLRDVAVLAEQLINAIENKQAINDIKLLDQYVNLRKKDQDSVIRFTDGLASLFYNENILKQSFRSLGMAAVEHVPVLKHSLMLRAMGLYGEQATMVKQSL